ncbi:MAG: hypothetical protein ACK5QS_08245 [Pseudanabaenaceae cyanobacterium]|jgi:hypothetical protein
MFLVQDSSSERQIRIKKISDEDPILSLILAVIHFEWTIRRAIISLSTSPNISIRSKLDGCHGLKAYKDLWKQEVSAKSSKKTLPDVVKNWEKLGKAFQLRNKLVHGVSSAGSVYARERTIWALEAANYVSLFCHEHGIDLDARLRVRRSVKS